MNAGIILKSAEKVDTVIIAWGKVGENNKRIRDVQNQLLAQLQPYSEKLYEIAGEKGDAGFHPLAPQIRFVWILKKFEFPAPEGSGEVA
ncbi:DUF1643 domain-containing protein [Synergistaceae bacterium OttesenSCG-928-I11]|nr:DUF1643 domain-containing protein [Synergistaceae bacterium OttesenSCG-928-I11]